MKAASSIRPNPSHQTAFLHSLGQSRRLGSRSRTSDPTRRADIVNARWTAAAWLKVNQQQADLPYRRGLASK
jgi:hypothetical protein